MAISICPSFFFSSSSSFIFPLLFHHREHRGHLQYQLKESFRERATISFLFFFLPFIQGIQRGVDSRLAFEFSSRGTISWGLADVFNVIASYGGCSTLKFVTFKLAFYRRSPSSLSETRLMKPNETCSTILRKVTVFLTYYFSLISIIDLV